MTSAKDLSALYDYGYWANGKLLDVVSQLTQEQFTQSSAGSYGSVRNTLVHILSAEWGWLDRGGGAQRGPALAASDYPTVTSLIDRWREVEAHVREFLSNLNDEDLNRTIEFSFGNGPKYARLLGELMHHAAIHGIHHRGQVSLSFDRSDRCRATSTFSFTTGVTKPSEPLLAINAVVFIKLSTGRQIATGNW